MKTRNLLVACLGLTLLGTGCATVTQPPGVGGSEYRDWRVTEYRRGHLRPADPEEQLRLAYFASQRFNGFCGGNASYVPGSFCNPRPSHMAIRDLGNNGRTRVVVNPTETARAGKVRAY
jgi:hypothetical protein